MIDKTIPIVLMHAFPLDATLWEPQRPALGARTVLTPDFPGFGGQPPGAATLDGFADHGAAQSGAVGFIESPPISFAYRGAHVGDNDGFSHGRLAN